MQLTSLSLALTRAGFRSFSPASLFAAGDQGVWYDPSDFGPTGTLFQDSSGTTPVTALEQPVGLMLDKSRGLVLGSELVVNGGFATDTTWNKGTGWSIGSGVATKTAGTAAFLDQPTTVTAGRFYLLTYTATVTAGAITPQFSGGVTVSAIARNVSGTYSEYMAATAGTNTFRFLANSAFVGFIDNISVRELPGNHASQPTATSRPVVSARVNLLTKTEQFDDAAWTKVRATVTANSTAAPDGTLTADKLVEDTTASNSHFCTVNNSSSGQHTLTVYAKAGERDWLILASAGFTTNAAWFDLSTGETGSRGGFSASSIVPVGNGWYRCSATIASLGGSFSFVIGLATADNIFTYTGDGTSGIYIWGADLRVANDGVNLPPYQRVNTATDYDSTGFPVYLRADGVDDGMVTNSIDFTATDKMTVVAGVRKLSDANGSGGGNPLLELSASATLNNGAFFLLNGYSYLSNWAFRSKGTIQSDAVSPSNYVAPITSVVTGIGNISGDSAILRVNAIQATISTADQGTGNFGNYPLYLFRRGGATLPFNGRFYGLTIVNKLLSTTELAQLETYTNSKTRAFA
jgi:hypothetical protein